MHPVINRLFSGKRFVLRYFVFVVNGNRVYAAGVQIEHFAEIFSAHCATFDMPAGITHTPRAFPLHNVVLIRFFPKRKIRRVAFFAVFFHACACFFFVDGLSRQFTVRGEFGYVEVNSVAYFVSVAFFEQFLYEFYHFRDMLGRFCDYFGFAYVKRG